MGPLHEIAPGDSRGNHKIRERYQGRKNHDCFSHQIPPLLSLSLSYIFSLSLSLSRF